MLSSFFSLPPLTNNRLVFGSTSGGAGLLTSAAALTYAASGTNLLAQAQAAGDVPFAVQGAAGQTGSLLEARSSGGSVLSKISGSNQNWVSGSDPFYLGTLVVGAPANLTYGYNESVFFGCQPGTVQLLLKDTRNSACETFLHASSPQAGSDPTNNYGSVGTRNGFGFFVGTNNTRRMAFDADGYIAVNSITGVGSGHTFRIYSKGASDTALMLRGASGATSNIFESQLSDGSVRACITSTGQFSNNGGSSSSGNEVFGAGATVTPTNNADCSVFGNGAVANGWNSIVIGRAASSSGVGGAACAIAIGNGASVVGNVSVVLGYNASNTTGNQFVVGGAAFGGVTEGFFGSGVTGTTPSNFRLNATGGSGTDIAGASFTLAGGRGTGSAAGGDLLFQTAPAGASGTTLGTLATRLQITGAGNIGFFGVTPVARQALPGAGVVTADDIRAALINLGLCV